MVRNGRKNESGAFAIEAVLTLTAFIVAIVAIMFISLIAKTQASIQYALGQTAKEISGYYYLLDKAGITALTGPPDAKKAAEVDKTIGYVLDFSDESVDMYDKVSQANLFDENSFVGLDIGEEDFDKLYDTARNIGSQLDTLSEDPKGQIMGVLSVFAKTMINKGMSYAVAPMVCKAIMPRYLGGSKSAADEMLKASGIEGGIDGIDFYQSQLLTDGRSIKLVAVYEIDASAYTLGLVKKKLVIRQTASTASWLRPDNKNTFQLQKLKIKKKESAKKEDGGGDGEEGT